MPEAQVLHALFDGDGARIFQIAREISLAVGHADATIQQGRLREIINLFDVAAGVSRRDAFFQRVNVMESVRANSMLALHRLEDRSDLRLKRGIRELVAWIKKVAFTP